MKIGTYKNEYDIVFHDNMHTVVAKFGFIEKNNLEQTPFLEWSDHLRKQCILLPQSMILADFYELEFGYNKRVVKIVISKDAIDFIKERVIAQVATIKEMASVDAIRKNIGFASLSFSACIFSPNGQFVSVIYENEYDALINYLTKLKILLDAGDNGFISLITTEYNLALKSWNPSSTEPFLK